MSGRSGHGIKRPDHGLDLWVPGHPRKISKSKARHLKSVFSDKPDPSLHADVVKRKNLSVEETRMKIQRSKEIAMEARDLQDLCRQFTLKATEALIQILDDPDAAPSAKLQAIGMLWDRGYGKPAQTQVNINANADAKPSELDAQSLDQRITDALNRVEKLANGKTEEGESKNRSTDLRKLN